MEPVTRYSVEDDLDIVEKLDSVPSPPAPLFFVGIISYFPFVVVY